MSEKWMMPSYYPAFRCKADKCRHTCCHGWKIPIGREEYYRLLTANKSDRISELIAKTFVAPANPTDQKYREISFNYLGDCPLMEDGLCLIHKEMGADALPGVCDLYPRSLKRIDEINVAVCSCSCERVAEILMEENDLGLRVEEMEGEPVLNFYVKPELRDELMHFHALLQDRSTTLVESLVEICLEVNGEQFTADYNTDRNPLSLALEILDRLVGKNTLLEEIYDKLKARYHDNYFLYEKDRRQFEKNCPQWMRIFENVMNNSMLYENFPFVDTRCDRTSAYKGLCATYGLLRFVCIGNTADGFSNEKLADAISALFRLIDHSSFYYNVSIISSGSALLLKL
ncbi:MAG: flagellin lysine-N-methylase [Erysipelotrichaceae bacterium]|nr:flagellin lysine-N-methylase [Erysipelotrichaceae bacterium]